MRWTTLMLLLLALCSAARASDTAITYQGQLKQNGVPYNGTPDMQFRLWSDLTSGFIIPPTNVVSQVPVQDGLFQVVLDFGYAFNDQPLYLEVSVDGSALSPRQLLTRAPAALGAEPWKRSPAGISYANGPIGIGTPVPGATLQAAGSVIFGSSANIADGFNSFVGGGDSIEPNSAAGYTAFVAGGANNHAAGSFSFAGGYRARALHDAAFVWSDFFPAEFASTGGNQFLVRARGGVGINTNAPVRDLHVKQVGTNSSGVGLELESDGGSAWGLYVAISDNLGFRFNDTLVARINAADGQFVSLSDGRLKQDIQPVDGVLDRVLQLVPSAYRMKGASSNVPRSFGLIAQDVQRLFPEAVSHQEGIYGVSYAQISVLNTAALIELDRRYRGLQASRDARLSSLEAENAMLRARLADAEQRFGHAARQVEARLALLEVRALFAERLAGK